MADYWGPDRYAVINGVFNAPLIAAGAIAPAPGRASPRRSGSYPAMFSVLARRERAAVGAAPLRPPPGRCSACACVAGRAAAQETSGSVREPGREQPDAAAELG